MKKYIALLLLITVSFAFTACDDETEPGGTAVEKMAGTWWVTINAIVDGQKQGDIYGVGHFQMSTYNTAANKATEMWIEDMGNFWNYKLKVDVDYTARTFSTKEFINNVSYECKVKIIDGKILKDAATTPSGMPADSIVYTIQFDDDDPSISYEVAGFRRTGFPADDF